jgi:hypothetical protein
MEKKGVKKTNSSTKVSNNTFGFTAFILGIFSLVFFWTIIPPIIMGITAIVFGILQLRKGKSKFAIAGLVLSIIALIISIILLTGVVQVFSIASLAIECQSNPNSEACDEFAELTGGAITSEVLSCLEDPSQEGCEQILAGLENQNGY